MMREMRAAIIDGSFGDWRRDFQSKVDEGGGSGVGEN